MATSTATRWRNEQLDVQGLSLETLAGGQGEPLVVLHDQDYLNTGWPYLDALAERFSVVVPSHPGFGKSPLPDDFDHIDDLVYVYLDLLRELKSGPARLVGFGLGGWLAAEIAVRCAHNVDRLMLAGAVGIKVGGPTERDIADNFLMDNATFLKASWHDPERGAEVMKLPGPGVEEDDLVTLLRNRQSTALFAWKPWLHNPKLKARLRRINVPSLVLWGDSDGIVKPDYGQAYAAAIPNARFEIIANAGHYPYLEQPEAFNRVALPFLNERTR
ncbi:MAG TPA: alpha/beta hydrolase [Chloroflexota bacterium]|nr:alpha/beta hydrolase [Chloroflexota bacterium]